VSSGNKGATPRVDWQFWKKKRGGQFIEKLGGDKPEKNVQNGGTLQVKGQQMTV